jgi:hypothetical protein
MTVTVDGRTFTVAFTHEWFRPALLGAYGTPRIRQATTCTLQAPDGAEWADGEGGTAEVSAQAHCSVADRYRHVYGCRVALDRAVERAVRVGMLPGPEQEADALPRLQRAFNRQVLPVVAAEYAARPGRKLRGPGRHALARELARVLEDLRLIGAVVEGGGPLILSLAKVGGTVVTAEAAEEQE